MEGRQARQDLFTDGGAGRCFSEIISMFAALVVAALVFPSMSAAEYLETKHGAKSTTRTRGKDSLSCWFMAGPAHRSSGRRMPLS